MQWHIPYPESTYLQSIVSLSPVYPQPIPTLSQTLLETWRISCRRPLQQTHLAGPDVSVEWFSGCNGCARRNPSTPRIPTVRACVPCDGPAGPSAASIRSPSNRFVSIRCCTSCRLTISGLRAAAARAAAEMAARSRVGGVWVPKTCNMASAARWASDTVAAVVGAIPGPLVAAAGELAAWSVSAGSEASGKACVGHDGRI